tara:strand:- start:2667 stop:2924 length:258 start_codon:yes stop_codon:yes gene_type:complete
MVEKYSFELSEKDNPDMNGLGIVDELYFAIHKASEKGFSDHQLKAILNLNAYSKIKGHVKAYTFLNSVEGEDISIMGLAFEVRDI